MEMANDGYPLKYRVTYNDDTRRYYIEREYVYRTSREQIVAKGLTYREAEALVALINAEDRDYG